MKKLTRQERVGALALAGVAIIASVAVFMFRYVRAEAVPVPAVTVIHTSQDKPQDNDTTAQRGGYDRRKAKTGDRNRKKKGHKKDSGRGSNKKKSRGDSEEGRGSVRSPLDEPVPVRPSSTKEK